jgi:hypothetical protein
VRTPLVAKPETAIALARPRREPPNTVIVAPQQPPYRSSPTSSTFPQTTTIMSFLLRTSAVRAPACARAFSSTPRSQVARMTVIGRLGISPEETETTSGSRTLVRYIIGTNHGKGENQKTSWFRVASFVEGPQKDYLLNVPKG